MKYGQLLYSFLKNKRKGYALLIFIALCSCTLGCTNLKANLQREEININEGWRFMKYDSLGAADNYIYDIRPEVGEFNDAKDADSRPTEAIKVSTTQEVLKPYILPTGNEFINDPTKKTIRPQGSPASDFPFVKSDFTDSLWQPIDLPHDWAINGPFQPGWGSEVGGSMGRLPSPGIGWYRKKIHLSETDAQKTIFLNIDGAMSYSMVWVNGVLAGGWPYGYTSYQIDITPYLKFGSENQLAIRVDNPNKSSRWYTGGGIYRDVWLTKVNPIHLSHWGTTVTTESVSDEQATIKVKAKVINTSATPATIKIDHQLFFCGENETEEELSRVTFKTEEHTIAPGDTYTFNAETILENPKLWGPPPTQKPNMYRLNTSISVNNKIVDINKTSFGIRCLQFDSQRGIIVNGEPIYLKGVNQHHDLGPLGAAFNKQAAARQLQTLKELGANAIRMAHNPTDPELLKLTDKMGFLVIAELYDSWESKKSPHDFHLGFPDWYEQDLRALIRRDKNHPSVIMWSTGNEVGEQYTGSKGASIAAKLREIAHEEDSTRPTTASMNYAKSGMPFPKETEVISLNYQGEGIREGRAYSHLKGIKTSPLYDTFQDKFPDKVIISSENASALSTRGTYIFPVYSGISAPVSDTTGGDPKRMYVSAYELYTAPFGSSPDKVFKSLDQHPYVAGGFVWSGWDYLGEPTPYYLARSSYCGLIDLAGFKKDRFYLYQSRWRPDLPMVHILPHWDWPDRVGLKTPVHVFTSGDEAELYLNGKFLGRKKKGKYEYRLRWDDVVYEPGELKVIAYKEGEKWAEETIETTSKASEIVMEAEKKPITSDSNFNLTFVLVSFKDAQGRSVPTADNLLQFELEGDGEILATDNGDPTDMTSFASHKRKAFSGKLLVIIKSKKGSGSLMLKATSSDGLKESTLTLEVD